MFNNYFKVSTLLLYLAQVSLSSCCLCRFADLCSEFVLGVAELVHWPQNWEPKEQRNHVAATAGNKAFIHYIEKGKDRRTGKEVS